DGISHDAFGGAVYIGSNATLFINAVHLTGNSGGAGGAILNWGTLKGANSSFVGNNGQSGAAIGHVDAATTLVNTTISQNTGSSSIVYVQGNGDFNLVNLTLASNTATDAIYFTGVTTDDHTFQSVILSDNSGNNCTNVSGAANLSASGSYSDDATCGFAVQGGADSTTTTLGSLVTAANGTQYHPLFGGDALDGGSSTPLPSETTLGIDVDQDGSLQATPVDIDQRNGSRTINTIDAGAVEISCAHAAYDTALSSVNGYTLGTLNTNLVEDLRMAVLCANRNGTDDLIDLDSRTVTLFYVLAPYDTDGYNAMPSIENSGTLTIKDGTIERDSSLFRCNGGSGDRTDFRFFHVSVAANLTLQDLTLQNGCAHDVTTGSEDEYGGAVYNLGTLNVDTVNFTGNRGNQTGAIYNSGTLNITMGNFTNSRGFAGTAAGGIYNTGTLSITGGAFTDNEAIEGAGIYNSATGTSRINAVHFTGNHGLGGGGIRSDGNLFIANSSFVGNTGNDGAAIHQEGLETIIVNTTFSGNVAPSNSSSAHSILYTELGSTATFSITNSTFADNEAFSIIAIYDQGDHYVHNVIFANNDEWHQCYGEAEIVSATGSYDQTADCGFNARGGKDRATISVGSLSTAANGTQYHPLTGGDPVNGGDASVLLTEADLGIDVDGDGSIESTAISVDQRDGARVIGRALDAGAYEVACSDGYSSALPTANGYTIGTVMTDIAEDLRLAMECANANGTDDRIDLDGQTATLSAAPSAYDNASIGYHGLPIIGNSGSLVIGNGTIERDSALTTCDGTGGRTDFRLLAVSPAADLDLENLVLQNGCAHDVMAGTVYDGYGGGILNFGTLHLNTVHLTGNTALSCGAIYNRNGTIVGANTSFVGNQDSSAYAAAMCQASNGAQTTLVNSTFSQNVSPHADGAVLRVYDDGPVTLINSTFSENTAYSVFYFSRISPASHKLFNLILTDNTGRNCSLAFADGDVNFSATSSFSDDTTCDFASQGGTDNESTLLDSLATAANGTQYYPLIGGTARNGGDNNLLPTETDLGIDVNQDGLIESEVILVDQRGGDRVTSTTVDAGAHEAVCTTGPFSVAAGDERALVEAITCANDETINPGADVITLTASTYTFNGILATADGSNGLPDITSEITINGNNSTIQRDSSSLYSFRLFHVAVAGKLTLNQVTVQNGLLSGGSFGPPQDGGGIYNRGTLTLTNSTLADNSADIAAGGYGGGLANAGTVFIENSTIRDNQAAGYGGGISNGNNDVTSMTNSTLSGNTTTGSYGGGIYNQGTFTVSHSTIVSNTSNSQGGGIYTASGRNSTVANSIIAHNSQDCGGSGTLTASGTNIDVDGQCASSAGSNFTTTDPFILPLQDNGGDTWTHALVSNSPAIDTGASADCFATDQRGESRTDWACDIGAYELMFSDSDTVSKTVSTGVTVSFGGTLVKATVVNDGGCLTGITVQRVAGDHPSALTNIQTGRYWTITPTPLGCSGFDVTLTLPYDVTASSRDKACRYTGSGWDCGTDGENTPSTSGPVAMPNIVIRTNISQFSDWAVGAEVGPTAITLRSFSANARASQTSWLVALLSGLAALGLGLWRWVTRNAKAAHEK
ncbi:MAG: hypothetical protein GY792_35525, partial [Gammaproteobacteria bacterium]|nr:hypothetical protein [Gammaproteobacteria bacterium]